MEDPLGANEHNVTGTLNVLEAARRLRIRRVVYASSSSVYGDRPDLPKREEQPPAPISPYAVSKAAGEQYASVWSRLYGVETVGLRYFNVFGPRQDPTSEYAAVIPRFILWGSRGEPLQVHGDGSQSRDFTYVDNVVEACLLAGQADGVGGEVFNVGCGVRISLLEIVGRLETLLGRRLARQHTPTRAGDVRHTLADIEKAKRLLGYVPVVEFDEGLRRDGRVLPGTRPVMRPLVWLGLAGLGLVLAVGGTAAPASLIVQVTAEPPGLDLTATSASATATAVLYNIQECLVKMDRHGKITPWLAERWQTAPDGRSYTFFLKRGVKFHNGRALRADDVKFVIERAMKPETNHPHREHYASIADITVKDESTLTFTLKQPNPNFLLHLARQGSVIYPREAVETLKSAPVGTGPFVLAEWVRGDRIVLRRNPDYHVSGVPRLERVTFRFIPDPNAALAALKAGDIDASLFGLGPEHVSDLKRDPRFTVITGDTTNDVVMAMNNSRKPYADVKVRRAITHAIDKRELLEGAMFGLGKILGTNVDPLHPYFVDLAGGDALRPGPGQKAPGRGRLSQRLRDRLESVAPVSVHRPERRDHRPPARPGRRSRADRAGRVGTVAGARVLPGSVYLSGVRPDDHRPRRGLGPRQLRQPEILFPLRQPRVPGALSQVRGHRGRPRPARALRADAAADGGGRPGGLPLYAPAPGRGPEGATGALAGSADAFGRPLGGVVGASAVARP